MAILARNAGALRDLAHRLPGSLPLVADVTHFGSLDGLINNAGQSHGARVEEIDPEPFEQIFRLNVLAPIIAMQTVVPFTRATGGGVIVNISSGTAFMAIPGYSVYSASKRAQLGVTQTARAELAGDGIVINAVYPTLTATNFGANRIGTGPDADYSVGDPRGYVAGLIDRA